MLDWKSVMALPAYEIFPGTPEQRVYIVMEPTEKKDIAGKEVFAGDIIEKPNGIRMEIRFGTYLAWCPEDECYMDSVGFYAQGLGLSHMPVGPLEDYAKVIGNIYENPELMSVEK